MLLRDLVTSGSTIGEVEFIFEFECEFVRVLAWISRNRGDAERDTVVVQNTTTTI